MTFQLMVTMELLMELLGLVMCLIRAVEEMQVGCTASDSVYVDLFQA